MKDITFIPEQPFRTLTGDVITMKALVTINGVSHVESHQDNSKHYIETLTPMTAEQYEAWLDDEDA